MAVPDTRGDINVLRGALREANTILSGVPTLDPVDGRFTGAGGERPESPSYAISKYKTYYYSGGQAQIYMNDIFLDELNNLQFSTVTNKTPIYGYASRLLDTVAAGNILIQGTFTINFVDSGYLQILARALREDEPKPRTTAFLRGGADIGEYNQFQLQQAINQIRGLGNEQFRIAANEARKNLAGDADLPGAELLYTEFYDLRPFDIYARFGDQHDPSANHTTRQIKEVYLTGQSQVVSSTGDPVQEMYSFIARDIVSGE